MAEKRDLTVHFMDGSKMSFSFPKQVTQDEFVSGRLDKILGKPALIVEADGAALMIPVLQHQVHTDVRRSEETA